MPKLVSVEKTKAIEQAQVNLGVSLDQLMLNAGAGLADIIRRSSRSSVVNKKIVALVGKGNNGGDALVALKDLVLEGWQGIALIFGNRNENDPLIREVHSLGCEVKNFDLLDEVSIQTIFSDAPAIIDGILGTGFRLPIKSDLGGLMASVNQIISQHECQVFAVDCPSGVNCDTGECTDQAIKADVTVCMSGIKQGLLIFPAAAITGRIEVVDIGITDDNLEWVGVNDLVVDDSMLSNLLPFRPPDAHKGSFGKVLICGGCVEYPGAPILNALGAYGVGTGLVRVATIGMIQQGILGRLPEAVWLNLPNEDGYLSVNGISLLNQYLSTTDAIVLGSGMGTNNIASEFVEALITSLGQIKGGNQGVKLVIDADGLRLVAKMENWYSKLPPQTILTPHPGEFQAISSQLPLVGKNRLECAKTAAEQWNCVIVLKGAMTVIADPNGHSATIPIATTALAKAGSGDVLAGMIGGFLAQGLDGFEAGVIGAGIHALAGLEASSMNKNDRSILASDLVNYVGNVFAKLEDHKPTRN